MKPAEEIRFLSFEEICEIHDRALKEFGQGLPGFLDENIVRSAAGEPKQGAATRYFHEFPAGMAAAYIFYLPNQQGFLNGNKRAAVGAATLFLALDGYKLRATNYEAYEFTKRVAGEDVEGNRKDILAEITNWIIDHLAPIE